MDLFDKFDSCTSVSITNKFLTAHLSQVKIGSDQRRPEATGSERSSEETESDTIEARNEKPSEVLQQAMSGAEISESIE